MTGPEHGVDFVDDDGEHGDRDEDLPSRRPDREPLKARFDAFLHGRYGLTVVVVIVVLAYLVVRALRNEGPGGVLAARPSATPSGTSVTVDASNGRAVVALPTRTGPDPTRCPRLQCYTASSVPAAVRAAVRAVFPTATFGAAETVRLTDHAHGDPLWYREVVARVGSASLTVRVQAHAAGDTPDGGSKDDGNQSVTYVDAGLQDWFVRARFVDRSGTADVFDQLSALVDDRRLLEP